MLLQFVSHSQHILSVIKNDLITPSEVDTPDLIIICKNDEMVQTQRNLFCTFSPSLRDIFGSVFNMETYMVFMPDFKKVTVEKVIKMLQFEWREDEHWDFEIVQLLKSLNVHVGEFNLKVKEEIKSVTGQEKDYSNIVIDNCLNEIEEGDTTTDAIFPESKQHRSENVEKVRAAQNDSRKFPLTSLTFRKVSEVKCPTCSREFVGTTSKLRDQLKCHLGMIHFHVEIMEEIKHFFGNSAKCKNCYKTYASKSSKKKHLVFHHSK